MKTIQTATEQQQKVFRSLEEALEHPEMVYRLRLNSKGLEEFPPEITRFQNLRSLELKHNRISSIPLEICQLNNLQYLDVSGNLLSSIPPELANLNELLELRLRCNNLRLIPTELYQLQKLRFLSLAYNNLTSLPAFSENSLCSIETIDMSYNPLGTQPGGIGSLHNPLGKLPEGIGSLKSLQELRAIKCRISEIPVELTRLHNLKILKLRYNSIPTLPAQLIEMKSLKEVEISAQILGGGTRPLQYLPIDFWKIQDRLEGNGWNNLIDGSVVPLIPERRNTNRTLSFSESEYDGRFAEELYRQILPQGVSIPELLETMMLWRGYIVKREGTTLYLDRLQSTKMYTISEENLAGDFINPFANRWGFTIDEAARQNEQQWITIQYPERLLRYVEQSALWDSEVCEPVSEFLGEICRTIFFCPCQHRGYTGPDDFINPRYIQREPDDMDDTDPVMDCLRNLYETCLDFNETHNNELQALQRTFVSEIKARKAWEINQSNQESSWNILHQSYTNCAHVEVEALEPGTALLCSVMPYIGVRTSQSCDGHLSDYPVIEFYGHSNAGFARVILKELIKQNELQIEVSSGLINLKEALKPVLYGHWSVPLEFRLPGIETPDRQDLLRLFVELHKLARLVLLPTTQQRSKSIVRHLRRIRKNKRQRWLSFALMDEKGWNFA